MRWMALIMMLTAGAWANAAVYKWVDADGNVSFSDKPQPGAEQLQEIRVQSYTPAPLPLDVKPVEKAEEPPGYTKFTIVKPQADEAIRNNAGSVEVQMVVEPPLQLKKGHKIIVMIDGYPQNDGQTGYTATINFVDRGTHNVKAEIVDAEKKVIASAGPVTFHLFRHSIAH